MERFTCPRRVSGDSDLDSWSEHDDTCTHCGSIHPSVFMARIGSHTEYCCQTDNNVVLVPSDKDYMITIRRLQGAPFKRTFKNETGHLVNEAVDEVLFYFQHLNPLQQALFQRLFNEGHIQMTEEFTVRPYFMRAIQ